MTGGEAVARSLAALGVRHVFGIVSVHNLPIYDALDTSDIEVVACRHEQFAVHAADGYARATGRLGVALASSGPGTTNAVSGLYEAQFGSSPVLLVTGQTESTFYGKGKGFLHESEKQLDLLRAVTRRAETIWRTEDIGTVLTSVALDALTGRPQPVAVEIPIDQQYRVAPVAIPSSPAPARLEPSDEDLARAAELLSAARRPLVWAGGGVVAAGAGVELLAVATALGAPVITTIEGRGAIPETHELALGPRTDRRDLEPIITDADVVLAVGTRFQNYSTRVWRLPIPGQLVHLDADPRMIGLNYHANVAVVGDAKVGLARLAELLEGGSVESDWVARARTAVEADLERSAKEVGPDHLRIVELMRAALPDDAVVVRDTTVPGYLWGNRLLPILRPRTSIRPSSSAIGPGIGLAVGAALGAGTTTVLIVGDGGFQLGLGELATAAQYQLPLVVCVFNDRGYGVLRTIQAAVSDRTYGVELHTPDFAAVALGMGVDAVHVAGVDEFDDEFRRAVAQERPVLLDIDMGSLAPLDFPLPAHQRRKRSG
jgi:acetolactate synthase-1/2/3 large subunit